MEKKHVIGIFSLVTVGILGLGLAMAMPFGFGGFGEELTEEEFNTIRERKQAMQEAIESGDYQTWKTLMENRIEEMRTELTEENFQTMVERHSSMQEMRELKERMRQANEEGNYETFQELREQLGDSGCTGGFRGLKTRGRGLF